MFYFLWLSCHVWSGLLGLGLGCYIGNIQIIDYNNRVYRYKWNRTDININISKNLYQTQIMHNSIVKSEIVFIFFNLFSLLPTNFSFRQTPTCICCHHSINHLHFWQHHSTCSHFTDIFEIEQFQLNPKHGYSYCTFLFCVVINFYKNIISYHDLLISYNIHGLIGIAHCHSSISYIIVLLLFAISILYNMSIFLYYFHIHYYYYYGYCYYDYYQYYYYYCYSFDAIYF